MLEVTNQRDTTASPKIVLRVAMLGGLALTLFAVIFFRLWFVQILSGDKYLREANSNRVREVTVQAPRGDVVDRNGKVLVDNRVAVAIQVHPEKLPPQGIERRRFYKRLAKVLGTSERTLQERIVQQRSIVPYSGVTVKTDVPRSVLSYLLERPEDFNAVSVRRVYLRFYPHRELAAHLFGTVGQVSEKELKSKKFPDAKLGTIVGKDGIELVYDRYLRGQDGATRVQVDALGRPKGALSVQQPVPGKQVKLSIDLDLQRAGQQAMKKAIDLANQHGNPADAGGFVALDPRNGEVLAMGSHPSFDPNIFSKPLSNREFQALNSEENGAPLFNRAIKGLYPAASTFKLVTAIAGLQSGLITPDTVINDGGSVKISTVTFKNAGGAAYGAIALRRALQVSSDVYFYRVGEWANGTEGQPIQEWAKKFGFGKRTGIDLPNEFEGLIPNRQWRDRLFEKKQTDRPWAVGDNVNLAVGQGDIQVTPLQMAVAYATLANGSEVVRPHIGKQVENSSGQLLEEVQVPSGKSISIDPSNRAAVLEGLRLAASSEGGTSADVFDGFPYVVHGKTGTAERPGQADQSWYIAYVPDDKRPIVVAVTVEKGGFGAEAAAPAARYMLSEWFGVKQTKVQSGESRTR